MQNIFLLLSLLTNSAKADHYSERNKPEDCYKEVQTGDIIVHTSQSSQSKLVQFATFSKYSHVGVVFVGSEGTTVLEASKTTKHTPIKAFINKGKDKKYKIYRIYDDITSDGSTPPVIELTKSQKRLLKKSSRRYIGKKYDLPFKWSDDKMYCSELVWKLYDDIGIKLTEPKKMKNFPLWLPPVKKVMKKRWGGKINKEELVVAPVDITKSKYLEEVCSNNFWY